MSGHPEDDSIREAEDPFGDDLLDLPIRSASPDPENLTLFDSEPGKKPRQTVPADPVPEPSAAASKIMAGRPSAAPAPTIEPETAEQAVLGQVLERGPAASNVGEFLRSSHPPSPVALPLEDLPAAHRDEVVLEAKTGRVRGPQSQPDFEPSSTVLPRVGPPGRRIKFFYRILAAALDASIHVAVLLFLLTLVPGMRDVASPEELNGVLPGTLGFLLAFSFVYYVFSLMLWRRTPGMIWAGIESCAPSGSGLTFGQAFLRWVGVVVTIGLAGLPVLLSVLGKSASDILSGTVTRFSA